MRGCFAARDRDQFHDPETAGREARQCGKNAERRDEHDGCCGQRHANRTPRRPDHHEFGRDLEHDQRQHLEPRPQR